MCKIVLVANPGGVSERFRRCGPRRTRCRRHQQPPDAVGMFDQQVAGRERDVARGTVPFGKEADDCGGGGQGLDGAVGAKEQGGIVAAAIGVFEFAQVIVDGREQAKRQGSGSRKRRQAFRRRDVVVV